MIDHQEVNDEFGLKVEQLQNENQELKNNIEAIKKEQVVKILLQQFLTNILIFHSKEPKKN